MLSMILNLTPFSWLVCLVLLVPIEPRFMDWATVNFSRHSVFQALFWGGLQVSSSKAHYGFSSKAHPWWGPIRLEWTGKDEKCQKDVSSRRQHLGANLRAHRGIPAQISFYWLSNANLAEIKSYNQVEAKDGPFVIMLDLMLAYMILNRLLVT